VNGSPIVFQVKSPAPLKSLSGKWLTHDVFFEFDSEKGLWYGLAGASLETRAGSYPLTLEGATASGQKISFQQKVSIGRARYPTIPVKVAKKFTEPSPQQLEEIKHDQAVKSDLFARTTPEQEWSGRFLPPVQAPVSDVFGTRRVFNGKVQSMHQGLDYAVPSGTPIAALNAGTVLLARPLYFEGDCVVLDHGQGLLTLYLHLSEIGVKEGEQVKRGQQIGSSGGTGRATGPHLHVAVRWQGVYLDPASLFQLQVP
jgi:murein DD-endopeptidase MepM/ murein hydrolase activator NlpD